MAYDKEIKDKFIEMRAIGKSFTQIAEELDVCRQTLMTWAKEFEGEIKYLQFLQSDLLKSKYAMSVCSRIEHFGIILEKIRNALLEKDYGSMSIEKLVEIYFRYYEKFNEETAKIKCSSVERVNKFDIDPKEISTKPKHEWELED